MYMKRDSPLLISPLFFLAPTTFPQVSWLNSLVCAFFLVIFYKTFTSYKIFHFCLFYINSTAYNLHVKYHSSSIQWGYSTRLCPKDIINGFHSKISMEIYANMDETHLYVAWFEILLNIS